MTSQLSAGELVALALQTMRAVQYAFLITLGSSGEPHARLMQPFPPEDDLTIWFGASPRSRKVRDIADNPRVLVTYQQDAENAYLVVYGTAVVVDDLAERQRRWMDAWSAFFVGGPTGDDYVLLRVTPDRLEQMNFAKGVTPPPYGLQYANLVRGEGGWTVAQP